MNDHLKSIISEISRCASKGRLFEANIPPATVEEDPTLKDKPEEKSVQQGQPENPSVPQKPEQPNPEAEKQNAAEEKIEADNEKKEADKAKMEKEKAEQDITKFSSIKLTSKAGVSFLFGKMLSDALRTNKMDSLANEFSQKLKIDSKEGFENFKNNTIQFTNLKGYANFLESLESLIEK